ncbi:MAG: flagellar hook-associated protein FlgK [Pseudomonadota bacterium]
MTLSAALSKASQGLNMASRATDLISTNIANAQTPGYVRRSINVTERVVGGTSVGLNPTTVTRNVSIETVQSVRRAQITYQEQSEVSKGLQEIVTAIGDVNSEFSLSAQFDKFSNSMKSLAETPESSALQDQTITNAKVLAENIRDIASSVQEIREQADADIVRSVNRVNDLLDQLKSISGEIVSLGGASDVAGLQDEQDRLIDEISELFPINVSYNENGSVRVSSTSGATLLDLNVTKLEFTGTPTIPPEAIYAFDGEDPGAPYNDILSGLTIGGLDVTPTANKIQSVQGGKIGGLFKVRDEETLNIQKQIDSIAAEMIEAFRDNDTTLTDANTNGTTDGTPDGVPDTDSIFTFGTPGTIFTNLDDMLGVANTFQINAAVDPDQGGDKRRIRDGAEATVFGPEGNADLIRGWIDEMETVKTFDADTGLTGSQTIMSAAREFTALASLRNEDQKVLLEFEEGKLNTLVDQRDNNQGVNLDDEMNDLVFIQQLYSANAVLLQRANDMLQTILDIR